MVLRKMMEQEIEEQNKERKEEFLWYRQLFKLIIFSVNSNLQLSQNCCLISYQLLWQWTSEYISYTLLCLWEILSVRQRMLLQIQNTSFSKPVIFCSDLFCPSEKYYLANLKSKLEISNQTTLCLHYEIMYFLNWAQILVYWSKIHQFKFFFCFLSKI